MSYIYLPRAKTRHHDHQFPWLLFLFVSVALFVIFHWPLAIHRTAENYNISDRDCCCRHGGSGVREVTLLALCAVAAISLVSRPTDSRLRINGGLGWLILAFLAWALMSTMWAQDLR